MAASPVAFEMIVFLVALALAFDFMNGFHDAANSIATIVSTRVLRPHWAVLWASFFNFVAFLFFGLSVANTIGRGVIDSSIVDVYVILGALVGAIVWNVVTWWYGLPSSSSHALIGGLAGSAVAKGSVSALVGSGFLKISLAIVLSPLLGFALGTLFGGWRIVKTMGQKITKLRPVGGFCAETGGAVTLFLATGLGIPVSTTHTITGAIIGVGSVKKLSAVRWGVAERIVWAWVLTIPCAAFISALAWWLARHVL